MSVAEQTLEVLETISAGARKGLGMPPSPSAAALATANAFTMEEALRTLGQIGQAQREGFERLAREPAIARVVCVDEDGRREVIYISRAAAAPPFVAGAKFASYRSPAGRLASLPPGEWATVHRPGGSVVLEVVERALLRPEELFGGWDSLDTVLEAETFGPVTIASLRALLAPAAQNDAEPFDLVSEMLREEEAQTAIAQGVKKSIIDKMGLRDRPVLDRFQDEIFRLPINSRVALLGPPGSGKTTTLIKRLGQKLDVDSLEDAAEAALVTRLVGQGGADHHDSWLMFTPTELLRVYVKDAFAREGIAAPDRRIRTWTDHRRELARDALSILRKGDVGGPFVLREDEPTLLPEAIDNGIGWFEDFEAAQEAAFWDELTQAALTLESADEPNIAALSARIGRALHLAQTRGPVGLLDLAALVPEARRALEDLRTATEQRLKDALNAQIRANRVFLGELANYLDSAPVSGIEPEIDGDEEADGDAESDEDAAPRPQTPTLVAVNSYYAALRVQARSAVVRRSARGRSAAILHWLGDRGLPEDERAGIGRSLTAERALRRFASPIPGYLRGMPRRYRTYRRSRRTEGRWYRTEQGGRYVNGLEVDVMLLATLRAATALVVAGSPRGTDLPAVNRVTALFRNQILVDEATDFSPVQLACMAELANPDANSFFACGDFNQRITTWGVRDEEQLRWVRKDIDIREVRISYRQSRQLHDFAHRLALAAGGTPVLASLPEHVDNEGVAPALMTYSSSIEDTAAWLSKRIVEIEAAVRPRPLPAVAVLVNGEDQVQPIADALRELLEEHNLRAVACPEGRVIGQANDVRVFDVQHIKGLEFEAVFFVDVDRLAEREELFDKFLYVGCTRAATYLGITSAGELPARIAHLAETFTTDWR